MKRTLTVLILLFLLVIPLALAEDNLTDQAKEQLSALRGGLDIKTENVLEKEVTLPSFLKAPLKLILGIEEEATWQQLIVVLGVFIGFFILILNIAGFLPFFKEGPIKILASLIITALVSITGALDIVATFFFDIAGLFKWTASWGPLQMIVAILIATIVIVAVNWLSQKIKTKMKLGKAEEVGEKIKEGSESAEAFSKVKDKIIKENYSLQK